MAKICPTCRLSYTDESFEFCLNDGTRLVFSSEVALNKNTTQEDEPETQFGVRPTSSSQAQTVLPKSNNASILNDWATVQNSPTILSHPSDYPSQTAAAGQTAQAVAEESNLSAPPNFLARFTQSKVAAITAIVFALAHNYWQWLYMARPDAFVFPSFLWSANFIVWFLLLMGGAAFCLLALKYGKSGRGYALISLIMLAINLLLCLVPRRI